MLKGSWLDNDPAEQLHVNKPQTTPAHYGDYADYDGYVWPGPGQLSTAEEARQEVLNKLDDAIETALKCGYKIGAKVKDAPISQHYQYNKTWEPIGEIIGFERTNLFKVQGINGKLSPIKVLYTSPNNASTQWESLKSQQDLILLVE